MPWNPWTDRLPTRHELEEPHVLLDRLLDWSIRQDDPVEARWAVQTLADTLGVHISILPDDATNRANDLGDAWVTAVMIAGRDHEARPGVAITAVGKTKELRAVLDLWKEDADDTDPVRILEQSWAK
jgi:hypothetical protein